MPIIKIRPTFSVLLKNRGFSFLWMSQMTCQLADRIFSYVLIVLAFELTRSNLGVSLPLLAFGLASIIFGPLAGVFVDRWPKKYLMITTDVLRGILILIFPFANIFNRSLAAIFGFCFLVFTITQFFIPAENSLIPEMVEGPELILANSLFMGTWMFSSVMGFGIAAPLVFFTGESVTYAVVTALYFISALFLLTIPVKKQPAVDAESVRTVLEDLTTGFNFIRHKFVVFLALLKLFIATAVLAAICVLAFGYSETILKIGGRNFGYLVASTGFGMILGIYLISRVSHWLKRSQLIFLGFVSAATSLFLLAAVSDIYPALFFIFVLGFGNALITAPLQTVIHENTPEKLRGRVSGIMAMLVNSAFTLPAVLAGWLADIYGLRPTILGMGLLLLVGSLMSLLPRWFREV